MAAFDTVPLPNPDSQQPYQISVDKGHNVWTNLWSSDLVAKYDPNAGNWTLFDLPTRGTETRSRSLCDSRRCAPASCRSSRRRSMP